jgi:hypothetical protein
MIVKDMTENTEKKCFDRKKRGRNADFYHRRRKNIALPTLDTVKFYACRYGNGRSNVILTVLFDF